MSRESCHQAYPLLGFSVSQPALGCPLEFFPAMGTQELDDMINAYVPGPHSILDKRAAVSMEFFNHNLQTGELFKFFFVYEHASTTTSPASSSGMIDSGYGSSFNASPVLSESQWSQSTSSSSTKARKSSKTTSSVSRPQDFSHIPGFSIMTKDGQDVTHSASRGMKTKEQRDHAHLMRVIKACESCRRKKTRCDPSHKKRNSVASTASESSARASKKTKKTASTAAPSISSAKAQAMLAPSPSAPATAAESLLFDITDFADEATAESWEQFVQYDEPVAAAAAPNDWEHFFDTAGYYSPSASHTNSTPMSPSRVIQPSLPASPTGLQILDGDVRDPGFSQEPTVPYLNPGGLGSAGSNYMDFNLYSPGSTCLDDDPAFIRDVTASWPDCTALPLSQCHPGTDRQPESIGTLQSWASPSQRHPSVGRQAESIGTPQSTAPLSTRRSSIDRQPESIGTLQPLASSSAMQAFAKSDAKSSAMQAFAKSDANSSAVPAFAKSDANSSAVPAFAKSDANSSAVPAFAKSDANSSAVPAFAKSDANSSTVPAFTKSDAPVLERRSRSQDHALADRLASPQREVDQMIDGGDMFHKSQSEASERQSPVLSKKHTPVAGGVAMSMPEAAHEPYRILDLYGSSAINGHISDVRDDARDHNDAQGFDIPRSVDNIALTSGDLGTQNPKPSPAVERARTVPLVSNISDQDRRDGQPLATRAIPACSAGEDRGTATCLQSMAALVQGAAILAVMATSLGQLLSWWPQRESKGSWTTSLQALPLVTSTDIQPYPASTHPMSIAPLSGDDVAKPALQLRRAAAVFPNRASRRAESAIHRLPLAVMG